MGGRAGTKSRSNDTIAVHTGASAAGNGCLVASVGGSLNQHREVNWGLDWGCNFRRLSSLARTLPPRALSSSSSAGPGSGGAGEEQWTVLGQDVNDSGNVQIQSHHLSLLSGPTSTLRKVGPFT